MVYFASESAKQLYHIIAPLKDHFLTSHNYEEWRFHMTWSLISQDLWHVARGGHPSEITLDKDYLVSKSIKLTIEYPLNLQIWQDTFCSSQELWDYLRSEFGQDNQHKKKQQESQIEQSYFGKSEAETQVIGEVIEHANEAVEECLPFWCQMQLGGPQLDVIEFGQQDFLSKKRKKKKQKKTKQQESPLLEMFEEQNSADFLILPVANLTDDNKNLFGPLGDAVTGNGNERLTEQCNIFSVFKGHINLLQEQDDQQSVDQVLEDSESFMHIENKDTTNSQRLLKLQLELPSRVMVGNDCCLIEEIWNDVAAHGNAARTVLQDNNEVDKDCQLYGSEYGGEYDILVLKDLDSCYIVEKASQDITQQLEVPFVDDFMDVADLFSMAQSFVYFPDYAATELISECTCMSFSCNYESMYKKFELSMVSWNVVLEHPVHVADLPDELILDFPWMDIHDQIDIQEEQISEFPWINLDATIHDFAFLISQVSQHALPLYIHLHIPFTFPHDQSVDDPWFGCLGCASYIDEILSKLLTVTYKCLHLPNQVLLIVDVARDQNLVDCDGKSGTWSQVLAGQFSEFQPDINNDSKDNCKFSFDCYQTEWLFYVRQNLVMNNSYSDNRREWYRGRKIWFKTNVSWQPWLVLWLSLLHMLESSTCVVLSLQQCSSSGGVLDLYADVYDDITLLTCLLLTWHSLYEP